MFSEFLLVIADWEGIKVQRWLRLTDEPGYGYMEESGEIGITVKLPAGRRKSLLIISGFKINQHEFKIKEQRAFESAVSNTSADIKPTYIEQTIVRVSTYSPIGSLLVQHSFNARNPCPMHLNEAQLEMT